MKHLKTPINENKYVEKILGASILGASILGAYSLGASIWGHGFGIWASIRGLRLKYEGGLQLGDSIVWGHQLRIRQLANHSLGRKKSYRGPLNVNVV